MNPFLIVPHYISWHYTTGLKGYISLVKTFTWFLWHFFSINLLFKTLFSPFQRLKETSKGKGLNIEAFFSALVTTLLMRLIGFMLRAFVIIFGIFTIVVFEIISVLIFLAWLLLPFIMIAVVIIGFKALFNFSGSSNLANTKI